jgi:hypothetical protein
LPSAPFPSTLYTMTTASLKSSFDEWQVDAPWADWNGRRRLAVALLIGLPFLVGGLALIGSLGTSLCAVWGGQCTPEEEQEIRTLSTVVWVNYFVIIASFTLLFLLRRRVFWLVAAVLGLIGFLDVVL